MKKLILALCLLLSSPYAIDAKTKVKETTIESSEKINTWINARIKNAKAGTPELVRFPIVGCMPSATCPGWWAIGFAEHMEEDQDNRWILAVGDGVTLPEAGLSGPGASWGPVLLAEGYFTGVKRMPTKDEGHAEATEEKLAEFKVLRFTNASQSKAERILKIVATGDEVTKKVDPFTDDRAWLVLTSSKPILEATSRTESDKLQERLVAAGFTDAEVFDSRKAKNLFCCYLVVAAGRYKTKEEAQAAVKKAKEKGFEAYAKQGW